jgi:glyoxylase-like metal-dependent hydrolase (beta-lactamase superfamily II)
MRANERSQGGPNRDGVHRVTGGVFPSNSYVCAANIPGGCFLVDPGLDARLIDRALTERGLEPRKVFCTHGHFDHVGSAAYFQRKYGSEVYLHKNDMKTAKACNFLLMAFKIPARVEMPQFTLIEGDDFTCDIGGAPLRYHAAPGHTPGSCVIEFGESLFTGDSLYAHGVGLSSLPGENLDMLRKSLLSLWDRLPEGSWVYPGHGENALFGEIRLRNTALCDFLGLSRPYRTKETVR